MPYPVGNFGLTAAGRVGSNNLVRGHSMGGRMPPALAGWKPAATVNQVIGGQVLQFLNAAVA